MPSKLAMDVLFSKHICLSRTTAFRGHATRSTRKLGDLQSDPSYHDDQWYAPEFISCKSSDYAHIQLRGMRRDSSVCDLGSRWRLGPRMLSTAPSSISTVPSTRVRRRAQKSRAFTAGCAPTGVIVA
ncbi:hypothetical protein HBI56_037320 [Parastagonospora nodorum]|uniref:Uncharacterized protein n=1 Tax=Phaeosphaeria nodorum (strain SN15 / ATCC MYA-4574 / FGSC 10173) TaxID=321614 RepID=A0A7U2EUZ7_PHANO|nr:hypothetical protein HBH56_069490 [Parastagonospora nodorum]QRC93593.1 hypothetical protein JI435_404130 [Parastagonospora nodorum SN15]KAH3932300.1 hypothetical protein HBH54_078640 [Parastagonospora nodorum]KAH3955074.1 hypothetical protein HBH53_015730 [Parastagonospora nodorum]KAH3986219.1 hypothetical protein HBH52_046890 [Parastagonospora nodorum]